MHEIYRMGTQNLGNGLKDMVVISVSTFSHVLLDAHIAEQDCRGEGTQRYCRQSISRAALHNSRFSDTL